MAGEKLKGPFSFKVAKQILSQPDLERLACAFLATENVYQFDHNKAATEFGGSKPDSFKRQIWVITKKIKAAMESEGDEGDDDDDDAATPSKSSGKAKSAVANGGGKKRKAGDGEMNGGDSKKRVVNGKGKKASDKGGNARGAALAVKAEPGVEDDEGDYLQ